MKLKIHLLYLLLTTSVFSFGQNHSVNLSDLNVLVGDWDVTAENRLSAAGPWETNQGKSHITKTTGNTLIEEEYTGLLQNKLFQAKTVLAFNHFNNKFQKIFIDSEHGVLIDYEGEKKVDSVFFDKTWAYPNKSTVKLRVVYIVNSPDEFTIINMRMPEGTTEWDVTGKMKYIRIK